MVHGRKGFYVCTYVHTYIRVVVIPRFGVYCADVLSVRNRLAEGAA